MESPWQLRAGIAVGLVACVVGVQIAFQPFPVGRSTGQVATATDSIGPQANPIYSGPEAIARAIELLPQGVVVTESIARLTTRLNAHLWLYGPNASQWATDRAEIGALRTPSVTEGDGMPYWVVGLRGESVTAGQALNTIGVEDNEIVEGVFFLFEAGSGDKKVHGALDTQTWTTYSSIVGLPNETLSIVPATPVIHWASTALPSTTFSVEELATIDAFFTATAVAGTP